MSLSNNTASLTAVLESVNALPEKIDTSGTAVAADIYAGKTATVNDVKLTGSNPYNADNVDPAVANALAELAEKGVDTAGAGLADIAGLIASIEAGGGAKVVSGTTIFAEDATTIYLPPFDALSANGMVAPAYTVAIPLEAVTHVLNKTSTLPAVITVIEPGQTLVSTGYIELTGKTYMFYVSTTNQIYVPAIFDYVKQNKYGLFVNLSTTVFNFEAGKEYLWIAIWE